MLVSPKIWNCRIPSAIQRNVMGTNDIIHPWILGNLQSVSHCWIPTPPPALPKEVHQSWPLQRRGDPPAKWIIGATWWNPRVKQLERWLCSKFPQGFTRFWSFMIMFYHEKCPLCSGYPFQTNLNEGFVLDGVLAKRRSLHTKLLKSGPWEMKVFETAHHLGGFLK